MTTFPCVLKKLCVYIRSVCVRAHTHSSSHYQSKSYTLHVRQRTNMHKIPDDTYKGWEQVINFLSETSGFFLKNTPLFFKENVSLLLKKILMINQEFLIAKFCGRFIKGGKYLIIILGSVENVVNSISNCANLSISVSFKEKIKSYHLRNFVK